MEFHLIASRRSSTEGFAEINVRVTMFANSPDGYPQIWDASRETRTLRMVANLRETLRERPCAQILTIVGVSHKPWLDDWPGQLQGLDIQDAAGALK